MPLYEYKCQKRGHLFEKIQKFSDKPEAECPKCGAAGERQLSAPAVHFKGSGWYITDSRKEKKDNDSKNKAASEKPSSDKPSSEKSKSSDPPTKKKADKPKKKD